MKIIDLYNPSKTVKRITPVGIELGVEMEVITADA